MKENSSGWEMKWVCGCTEAEKPLGVRSSTLIARAKRKAAVIPIGKPIKSGSSERFTRSVRRWTAATQSPAIGPNSGPTTIAPMIRIGESSRTPTEAIRQARTMKSRKLAESSVFSEVRASTSSQTTASEGAPAAAFSARSLASEIWESMSSIAIEPSLCIPNSFRSLTITLASSRATSQRITSPSGFWAARSR